MKTLTSGSGILCREMCTSYNGEIRLGSFADVSRPRQFPLNRCKMQKIVRKGAKDRAGLQCLFYIPWGLLPGVMDSDRLDDIARRLVHKKCGARPDPEGVTTHSQRDIKFPEL
ncbi:hypothetical protein [Bosea sp. ASV33]|uniref:hypothetical protein n=1 Tax=Bosea sp. ASV33 TaxID=2795106 RepID=UPI0018EB1AAB|nr:hypothetical protein [Bosea sp. ASV33]